MGTRYFEDFEVGQVIRHAIPRTIHGGDISLYFALTGERRPLASSTELAQRFGLSREMVPELLVFHIVFGKSVHDISYHAVANLGYARVRFLAPVYPGDTLAAESRVIGLKQTSSGQAGVVYVETHGTNQRGERVLEFVRWVLVNKRDPAQLAPSPVVPDLPGALEPSAVPVPRFKLERLADLQWAFGGDRWFEDYRPGDIVRHRGGMTLDESDHVFATRLYQNDAQVHFDGRVMAQSKFGRRLAYGGHVISVAHALACDGLENVLAMAAWNGGTHHHPTFAGDTLYAWSEIVECAPVAQHAGVGLLRMRLRAAKNLDASELPLRTDTETVDARLVLTLDYWSVIPTRAAVSTIASS